MTPSNLSETKPAQWIELTARIGYTAKGIVYLLIGMLAFFAALNWGGGEVSGSKGAFKAIESQPFGNILLFLIGVGLLGYVFWRFVQAIYDPEHNGEISFRNIGKRISYFVSGLIYGTIAYSAFDVVFDKFESSSGEGGGGEEQTAALLVQPFGRWLVASVGIAVIAYSFYCFYQGAKAKFRNSLNLREVDESTKKWLMNVARFGLFTKGFVSLIVGYFVISAAKSFDPDQTKTTEGALQVIQQQPFGALLIGIVGVGLFAYGVYFILQARYRKISPT